MRNIDIVEETFEEEAIKDTDFYSEGIQEDLLENDEEAGWEAAFMTGYSGAI